MQGKLLHLQTINSNENAIVLDTNALEEGIYIVAFFNKEELIQQQKIVKK